MPTTVEQIPGKTWPVENGGQTLSPTVSTAVSLSAPSGASWALIQPLSSNIRWYGDGRTPTITAGFQLAAGVYHEFTGDLKKYRAIAESGTPSVNVEYYLSSPTENQP
jgi:hypothetical protein